MVYREPWVDEEGRLLDEAEIAAFRARLRVRRTGAAILGLSVVMVGAIALAASSVPRERPIVFERKPECVYDGCFCRGERGTLVQTTCAPPAARTCLPIADRCEVQR